MTAAMTIAGLTVAPGSAARQAIELVELADGTRVALPALLINGARPGPRLYLGAGIHGDEAASTALVARALGRLKPEALAGSVVAVLVQNPLALQADHRIALSQYLRSPLDQAPSDPWSSFPGTADGSLAELIAHTLYGLITRCDYAVDCHTPTRGGRYVPITILPHPALGEPARRAEELALAFGSGYVMKTDRGMYVREGILATEATRAGVPAFTFELGEGGRVEPELVELGAACVRNALQHLGMLAGTPVPPERTVRLREFVAVRGHRGGLLQTEARLGAQVERGEALARIASVYGDELEVVTAPTDGLFVRATTLATVQAGERVATLALEA